MAWPPGASTSTSINQCAASLALPPGRQLGPLDLRTRTLGLFPCRAGSWVVESFQSYLPTRKQSNGAALTKGFPTRPGSPEKQPVFRPRPEEFCVREWL
jgi:hypothetical protein